MMFQFFKLNPVDTSVESDSQQGVGERFVEGLPGQVRNVDNGGKPEAGQSDEQGQQELSAEGKVH